MDAKSSLIKTDTLRQPVHPVQRRLYPMILIGQYDSPFVRRVGIAMKLYGMAFEHRPWSTFGDAEQIRPYSPLMRVPVLVLDSGEALVDSHLILDHLDKLAPAGRELFPVDEPARYRALKIAGLAMGLAEKNVSLFYEQRLHTDFSDMWVQRCIAQISGALGVLEADRGARGDKFWFGERMGHADIAVAVAWRHMHDSHADLVRKSDFPALSAHSALLEALPVFQEIQQPFIAPT
jgi:glutathione S-transferase